MVAFELALLGLEAAQRWKGVATGAGAGLGEVLGLDAPEVPALLRTPNRLPVGQFVEGLTLFAFPTQLRPLTWQSRALEIPSALPWQLACW